MENITVLQFDNFCDYISYVVSPASHYRDRPRTLYEWAGRMGYKSPSILSMVMKGQRLPSQDLLVAIAFDLNLSDEESRYLQLLVQLEKEIKKNKDISKTLSYLKKLRGHRNYGTINTNEFAYISNWYYFAVKNLVATKNFKEDYCWISKQFNSKITPAQARQAIVRMLEIGVLTRCENGHLKLPLDGLNTGNDIPSQAFRSHQKEMMERAKEALEEVEMGLRQISSLTLAMNKSKLPSAKKKILEFFEEFSDEFGLKNDADEVFQLNVQFFPHTLRSEDDLLV